MMLSMQEKTTDELQEVQASLERIQFLANHLEDYFKYSNPDPMLLQSGYHQNRVGLHMLIDCTVSAMEKVQCLLASDPMSLQEV